MEKTRKIYGVLITAGEVNTVEKREVEIREYTDWYPLLNCDIIDIVSRKIGDNYYDIVCDDEGLFKDPLIPTCVNFNENGKLEEVIHGNVFICKTDEEGELTSLTEKETEEILKNSIAILHKDKIQIVIKTTW